MGRQGCWEKAKQLGLLEADHLLDYVGKGSSTAASWPPCGDSYFETKISPISIARTTGGDSVPPSLVATALLLQAYDKVSDLEAKQRADFDIRWKVALGIEVEDRPLPRAPCNCFEPEQFLHDRVRAVFQRSLQFARQTGCLKGRRMKVAVDTTYILGEERARTLTTCWPTASSRWSGHWPNWMEPGPRSGP